MRPARLCGLAFGAVLSLSACEQIIGLEERDFDNVTAGEGGTDGGIEGGLAKKVNPELCPEYCNLVGSVCTAENKTSAYFMPDFCTALCPYFLSVPGATKGNNFECRLASARAAEAVKSVPRETEESCRTASPGGFGACGSNCESYCQLYASICPANNAQPADQCVAMCSALRDDRTSFNAGDAFSGEHADSIECRLSHLSAAAKATSPHCEHAQIIRTDTTAPCAAPATCSDFCAFEMNVCKDNLQQYESAADCMATCKLFDLGTIDDTFEDTLNCRYYHIYNSLRPGGAGTHCDHTGPGGAGHCGKICPAYCKLAKGACGAQYSSAFPGGDADCVENCSTLIGVPDTEMQKEIDYTVALGKAGGNSIQCRLYYTTKAASSPTECPSALGLAGSRCGP